MLAVSLSFPLAAQWVNLPTPGVPRNADGSPNLTAPAPRTADGKPNFSGLWVATAERRCDPNNLVGCAELAVSRQAVNFAMELKEGLPYQPAAAEIMKSRAREAAYIDPHVRCMPPNYPRAWALPETQKIFQLPGQLVILHEWNASYRQIFYDGRKLPDELTPHHNGYSVARWEGDALVVETAGYHDNSWLDTSGNFFGEAARVTERIRRPNFGTVDVEVTVNDPNTFTKPWTVTVHLRAAVDTEMLDLMCQEGEVDAGRMKR
jgi:hypothetical protein